MLWLSPEIGNGFKLNPPQSENANNRRATDKGSSGRKHARTYGQAKQLAALQQHEVSSLKWLNSHRPSCSTFATPFLFVRVHWLRETLSMRSRAENWHESHMPSILLPASIFPATLLAPSNCFGFFFFDAFIFMGRNNFQLKIVTKMSVTIQDRNGFIISLQRFYGKMEKHFTVQEEPFQSHGSEKDMQNKIFLCNMGGGTRTTWSK